MSRSTFNSGKEEKSVLCSGELWGRVCCQWGQPGVGAVEGGLAMAQHCGPLLEAPHGRGQPRFTVPEPRALWKAVCWHVQPDSSTSTDGEVLTSPVIQHTLVCFTFQPSLHPHCELHCKHNSSLPSLSAKDTKAVWKGRNRSLDLKWLSCFDPTFKQRNQYQLKWLQMKSLLV